MNFMIIFDNVRFQYNVLAHNKGIKKKLGQSLFKKFLYQQ